MNKAKTLASKMAKKVAENSLVRDANSTTCIAIYQPKAPAKLNSFKKEQK